jgi:putative ABC transport system ATP-binding protein
MTGRHAAREDDDPYRAPPVMSPADDDVFDIETEAPVEAPARPRREVFTPASEGASGGVGTQHLGYVRAGRTILDGVDMRAEPGEAVAVVGPSGSGKTSLLSVLAGLERPDSGTVTRDRGSRIGLILQSYGLVGVLTAAENVEAPLQAGAAGRMSRGDIKQRSAAVLQAVGLDEVSDHLIEELSGGQQQRVAVARALAVDPAIVFADELTAELDHDWKNVVISLVLDVARRGGIVLIATHDLELAARCDRMIRLADGRVVAA